MKLFNEYALAGKLCLKNRIMVPPMVTRLANQMGEVTDKLVDRYLLYAKGGAGFIVTEPASVQDQKSGQLLRLTADRFVPGLKSLSERIHQETDSKIGVQLIHFLKISRNGYRQKVEDLDINEIKKIPDFFASAAYRAREAGMDAVELHFAHAYTMASFLSRHNKRIDDYGSSLKKRMLLAIEVVEATRKSIGDDFVLGARINGDDFTLNGNTLKQSRPIAIKLAELGLDYISVSAGGRFEDAIKEQDKPVSPYSGYSGARAMPFFWMPEKVNVYLAANIRGAIREAGHETCVVTAGRIPNAIIAQEILDAHEADIVAVGRPTLADPYWSSKYKDGHEKDIVECIYCNKCKDAEGSFEETVCFKWKQKNGSS